MSTRHIGDMLIQAETLYDIADAIRDKTGGTDELTPSQMATAIGTLGAGGVIDVATAADMDALLVEDNIGKYYRYNPSQTTILDTTTVSISSYGMIPLYPELIVGETYSVVWDGVTYECVAYEATMNGATFVALGNAAAFELEDTGEPFVTIRDPNGDTTDGLAASLVMSMGWMDNSDTADHTIAIYQGSVELSSSYIVGNIYAFAGPSQTTILDTTTVSISSDGMIPLYPELIVGETYSVVWDGVTYECVAYEATINGATFVALGNAAAFELEDTGEPFVTIRVPNGDTTGGLAVSLVMSMGWMDNSDTADHTIAIYQNVNPVLEFNSDKPAEKNVTLTLSSGDMTLHSPKGRFWKKITITKPETLLPENVKQDVTIAGVTGTLEGKLPWEEKTVKPDFSAGDPIITPSDTSHAISQVTIQKPETLLPENIVSGVTIAGVEGEHECPDRFVVNGHVVKVFDYDGTVLLQLSLNEGDTFTLPSIPSHERLVFEGWTSPIEIVNNTITIEDSDVLIGALYHTASGATEVDITLTKSSGLTFAFRDVLTGMTSINWGDGTTDATLTHTYAEFGDYTIKIYGMTATVIENSIVDWTTYPNLAKAVVAIYLADGMVKIGDSAFYSLNRLETITIPKSVLRMGYCAFWQCSSLKSITIPKDTSINQGSYTTYGFLEDCHNLRSAIHPYDGFWQQNTFKNCYNLTDISRYHNPIPGDKSIQPSVYYNCYSLRKAPMELENAIRYYAFYNCYGLSNVTFNTSVTGSIGMKAFYGCKNIKTYDFSLNTVVPTLENSDAFYNMHPHCKILVPASLYDEWIAATNWSSYADHIVAVGAESEA